MEKILVDIIPIIMYNAYMYKHGKEKSTWLFKPR